MTRSASTFQAYCMFQQEAERRNRRRPHFLQEFPVHLVGRPTIICAPARERSLQQTHTLPNPGSCSSRPQTLVTARKSHLQRPRAFNLLPRHRAAQPSARSSFRTAIVGFLVQLCAACGCRLDLLSCMVLDYGPQEVELGYGEVISHKGTPPPPQEHPGLGQQSSPEVQLDQCA